ncbi:MAG TPA: NAD(P)H-dependent oxidoreductase [Acetobacteraceae bacterium]|nr:NAD(P)H-dependent oxidoreductase [Acetobacteraceae bacterium]
MNRVLVVESSPKTESFSRAATAALLARLTLLHSNAQIIRRDLGAAPPPHVDAEFVRGMRLSPEARAAEAADPMLLSETLIAELENCDRLVIATPMHNYTVPSALKAWIDHVVRARRSFGFGPQGKYGLLADRPTYLVTVSGDPRGAEGDQPDFLVPYLLAILKTIGITSVETLSVQRTARVSDPLAPLAGWLDQVLPLPTR